MKHEPFGHRGRPAPHEVRRAAALAERIGRLVETLAQAGVAEEPEVLALVAATAKAKADPYGESWSSAFHALRTVRVMYAGGGAKEWSIDAIALAVVDLESDLLPQEEPEG